MDSKYYAVSAAVRLGFLSYGIWQDSTMRVKFTDVDYYVFSDAAQFVTEVRFLCCFVLPASIFLVREDIEPYFIQSPKDKPAR